MTAQLLERVLHLLLPPACAGCEDPLSRHEGRVCPRCRTRLRGPSHPRCERCHAPRGTGLPPGRPCPECLEWPAVLELARSAVVLAPPADSLVHALKYDGWRELAPFLGERMVRALEPSLRGEAQVVVPVPTTARRRRERGYNQAELLAKHLAPRLERPLAQALVRRDDGHTQVALQRRERMDNVRTAFEPRSAEAREVQGRRVLLVDDVLTTGATAGAAALTLAEMGAAGIVLVAFARSLPGENDPEFQMDRRAD